MRIERESIRTLLTSPPPPPSPSAGCSVPAGWRAKTRLECCKPDLGFLISSPGFYQISSITNYPECSVKREICFILKAKAVLHCLGWWRLA